MPTDTVLATISKYSFDIGADLRPEIIKKDIGSLLSINKTDEKSRIIFDVKRYNDWANSDKLSGSSRGNLIGLFKASFGAAADISSRGTTNDQTLSDQMHELNTLSQNEAKWEIEGEKIIPKSLNVARILRSNMKTSLTFNRIRSKQFHVPFERNVKIYTSRSSQILCQNISTTKEIGPYEEMLESMSRNILYLMNASRVCPVGFHYLAEIDQCLRLNTLAMSWNDADRACREMATGGQLVMITSGVKQDAVKRYLERQFAELQPADCFHPYWQAKTAWISGQRQNPNRCDTPFVWKYNRGSDIPFTFTKWADRTFGCNGPDHAGQCVHNQPDCSNNEEHCAHIMSFLDYSWNDERCTASYCSVCAI